MSTETPKDTLLAGVSILALRLQPAGFAFEFREEGRGAGGCFAWGEFVRGDRRIELHYRRSLGEVSYRSANWKAAHEAYMRELGVWEQCRYPGFSSEYLQVFRGLAHDLGFAQDFLSGNASILLAAAKRELVVKAERSEQLTAGYVGDARKIEKMHSLFKEKLYAEVVEVFDKLHSPHLLSDAQLRLVQLARQRAGT